MASLDAIARQLADFSPQRAPDRHRRRRSAVAMLVRGERVRGPEILMIQRAERRGDPWSGHMGFPGGRLDSSDPHSFGTAVRETREELGFDVASQARYLGRLSDLATHLRTGHGAMLVTPYVFSLSGDPRFTPNHEVAGIVWVPLAFLADPANRQSMSWHFQGVPLTLPCYHYEQRRIWGLSLGMLDEFMAVSGIAHFESFRPPL